MEPRRGEMREERAVKIVLLLVYIYIYIYIHIRTGCITRRPHRGILILEMGTELVVVVVARRGKDGSLSTHLKKRNFLLCISRLNIASMVKS